MYVCQICSSTVNAKIFSTYCGLEFCEYCTNEMHALIGILTNIHNTKRNNIIDREGAITEGSGLGMWWIIILFIVFLLISARTPPN